MEIMTKLVQEEPKSLKIIYFTNNTNNRHAYAVNLRTIHTHVQYSVTTMDKRTSVIPMLNNVQK